MPAPAVTLRVLPIADVDLDPVAALVNRAFGVYSDMFKGQRTSAQDYRDEAGDEARVILVEDNGVLVATAMLALAERFAESDQLGPAGTERPTEHSGLPEGHPWHGALYVGLVGVEPGLMNRGFGRRIISHIEELARQEGFSRIALGTVTEFGLVDYYEKLAYVVTHRDTYPPGHWDFVIEHEHCEMVKHL